MDHDAYNTTACPTKEGSLTGDLTDGGRLLTWLIVTVIYIQTSDA